MKFINRNLYTGDAQNDTDSLLWKVTDRKAFLVFYVFSS